MLGRSLSLSIARGSGACHELTLDSPRLEMSVKRVLLCATLVVGCSFGDSHQWTVLVVNQWSDSLTVAAWNDVNSADTLQWKTVSAPPNGAGCLRFDPAIWSAPIANLQSATPTGEVVARIDFASHGQWIWTITPAMPVFPDSSSAARSVAPC